MNQEMIYRTTLRFVMLVALLGVLIVSYSFLPLGCSADDTNTDANTEFARTTIDIGMVVTDVDKSVKFYTEVIGFKQVKGFTAPANICKAAGLTEGQELNISVLLLGKDKTATKLKLMRVPDIKPTKKDTTFVPAQLGVRYLTVHITDTNAAMERLKKAGIKPLADGPVELVGLAKGVFLTVVRDPDGNMIELVGPKK